MIYLDNAATTFPKPESVYAAHDQYLRSAGNPGRGAHKLALDSARAVFEARSTVSEFLGARQPERLIFTPGCTYSINLVLRALPFKRGDVVLVSALEHNAVMRPLKDLQERVGIDIVVLPYSSFGIIEPDHLLDAIKTKKKPKLCVFSEASNVTGERLDLEEIGEICHALEVPLLLDAAQTAGCATDVLKNDGVTYYATSGHKRLMGAPGVGLLYLQSDQLLAPLVSGGTGSASEELSMPAFYPDRLEAGTIAGPAIAALGQGVEFVMKTGVTSICEHEHLLATKFRQFCQDKDWLELAGNSFKTKTDLSVSQSVPVVSFSMRDLAPDRVADLLDSKYGIAVRPGLHCAALAHQTLGTTKKGLVRASFGFFNTLDEVLHLCGALTELHEAQS